MNVSIGKNHSRQKRNARRVVKKLVRKRPISYITSAQELPPEQILRDEDVRPKRRRVVVTKKRLLNPNTTTDINRNSRRRTVVVTKKRLIQRPTQTQIFNEITQVKELSSSNPSESTNSKVIQFESISEKEINDDDDSSEYYNTFDSDDLQPRDLDSEEQINLEDDSEEYNFDDDDEFEDEYIREREEIKPAKFETIFDTNFFILPSTKEVTETDDYSEEPTQLFKSEILTSQTSSIIVSLTEDLSKSINPISVLDITSTSVTQNEISSSVSEMPSESMLSADDSNVSKPILSSSTTPTPILPSTTTLISTIFETKTIETTRLRTYTFIITTAHDNEQIVTSTTEVRPQIKTTTVTDSRLVTRTVTLTDLNPSVLHGSSFNDNTIGES